jgi:DNA-binding beta-propeller fold protein YncE
MKYIAVPVCLLMFYSVLCSQNFIEDKRFGYSEAGSKPGEFNSPQAISISPNRIVYVVDTGNNRIQLFDLDGEFIKSVGGFGFTPDKFDRPVDIWVNSLINIYISDYNNNRIQRYDGNMNFLSSLTSNDAAEEQYQFEETGSCAINSQQDLFLLDCGDYKIIKYNRNSQPERTIGDYESGYGQLIQAVQLDIVSQKYLIVSDIGHKAIMVYDFFGNYIKKIFSDLWISPSGIAVTNDNQILVADPQTKKIFFISSDLAAIKEINVALQAPLQKPQDIAFFEYKISGKINKKLYIIDNNNIIIGTFLSP